jgi:hypothetical protein
MLIEHCLNLEHLAIDEHYSPRAPVDAYGLLRGRWPNLRSLLMGDVVLDWHAGLNPASGKPFRTFLDAHRNLSRSISKATPRVSQPHLFSRTCKKMRSPR